MLSATNVHARDQASGVSMVTHEAFGWQFTPVVVQNELRGFIATNTTNEVVGSNFKITWFERTNEGRWSASAWSAETTKGEAVSALAVMIEGFDPEAIIAAIGAETNQDPVLPVALQNGLAWNDPLQDLVSSFPQPAVVVSALTDSGIEAAPALSAEMTEQPETPGEWPLQSMLDSFTERTHSLMLSSGGLGNTGLCYCTAVYGNVCTPVAGATWTVEAISTPGGGFKCIYRRESTVEWWYTSSRFLSCNECPAGGTVEAREVCIVSVIPGEVCAATPPSDCATSCIRN
jgi:hypothetical protein